MGQFQAELHQTAIAHHDKSQVWNNKEPWRHNRRWSHTGRIGRPQVPTPPGLVHLLRRFWSTDTNPIWSRHLALCNQPRWCIYHLWLAWNCTLYVKFDLFLALSSFSLSLFFVLAKALYASCFIFPHRELAKGLMNDK